MAQGHDESHAGGGQVRPLTQLVGGLLRAWTQGIEAFLGGAGLSLDTAAADPEEPQGFATILPGGAELSGAADAGQAALASALELSPAIAQAYVVWASSTIRYCGTLAELFIRHEASLLKATADRVSGNSPMPVAECRVAADDLRTFLREVGEAAMGEARRLDNDLAKIGESVARATDRATPSAHRNQDRRRHEVKP